jgi:DHA2 family multidrug resistance protein-like MFS transporter
MNEGAATGLGGLPPAKLRAAVLTIVIAVGMSALDTSIANTALPTIATDLDASPAASIWVVNAYQLAVVASLLPLGALGEIIGFRRVYSAGLAVFTVASLLCALSYSLPTLTAARVLQGFGAAGIMSVNTALIRFIYPSNRLGRGVGFNAMVVATSTALGPTVAAGVLSVAAWPVLFAINVPAGVVAMVLAARSLPATPLAARRFDWAGSLLSAATFAGIILVVGEASHQVTMVQTLVVLAATVVAATLLIRQQLGQAAPLLPIDLYRRPLFALSSATSMCSFTAQGLSFVSLPFLFQTVLGHSAVETGLLLTPWPVCTGILAPIAGPLSDRYPPAILGGVGLAILSTGLVLMATLPEGASYPAIMLRMAVCGAGFGFFQSPNLKALMSAAPPGRSGGASGTIATSRLLGQSTGAALVALCFGISGMHGPVLALGLAAGFAGVASVVSFSRLLAR